MKRPSLLDLAVRPVVLCGLLCSSACLGDIGLPGATDAEGDSAGEQPLGELGGSDVVLTAPDCTDVGPRMVRRLTALQFQNSINDLFQDPNAPQADFLSDPPVLGFRVDATQAVIRDLGAQQLMMYAEEAAKWAVANKLGQITDCQSMDADCRRRFIDTFGRRVYREPLSASSQQAYESLFESEATFPEAAELVIAAMLQSPYFLYRRELGEPDASAPGRFVLTPHELASNLSYFLTERPPDAELVRAAEEGRLVRDEDIEGQVDRLLAGDMSHGSLSHFLGGWLEIEDLPTRVKDEAAFQFTDEMREAMLEESELLFLDVFEGGGTVGDLLSASHTFVNQSLGNHYQIWGVAGDEPTRVEIPENTRAPGILGHGSVLARHALADSSSPVMRGVLVRERLLCETLPAPPANVDTNLQVPVGAVTTRERYAQHRQDPACAGCHALMDPVGYAFEHYDEFGRRREQEGGRPIDASGELSGTPDGDIPLDGAASLTNHLAQSDRVTSCFTRYLSYFAYGLDGCNPDALQQGAAVDGSSMRSIVLSIARAPHFRYRSEASEP